MMRPGYGYARVRVERNDALGIVASVVPPVNLAQRRRLIAVVQAATLWPFHYSSRTRMLE